MGQADEGSEQVTTHEILCVLHLDQFLVHALNMAACCRIPRSSMSSWIS